MDPETIIRDYYPPGSRSFEILLRHGEIVAKKSLEIADRLRHLSPDLTFIHEAAMLHDVGIFMTRAPSIGCSGEHDYVCHGYLGRKLLEEIGLPRHALVAERHTGAGITRKNIMEQRLSLPVREMVPQSLEETIICVADKFHSKTPPPSGTFRTYTKIVKKLDAIDPDHARRFSAWATDLLGPGLTSSR